MIVKIDIPDEVCFNQFKHFMDNTFDFELVKLYDISSNDTIQYLQIVGLKHEEYIDDSKMSAKSAQELQEEWKRLYNEGKIDPLYGNIKVKPNET